ncbi:putative inhibitor of apoptosis isoform X1 [Aphis gossypii]|uniref:putative inhibitor of apoptosis isoform X1 n=2 Tax=Aphis gossypii TaxID=80765 RepID=UPI002158F243|nr:putative inhibitor of apoptosis isoform X1 [Aphis gossypii]XP_050061467.1 putative inhibitor of apoptosis isoform X1 [Aphis gossypii]
MTISCSKDKKMDIDMNINMDFESRLKTFNENWSLTFISPFEMAQAGFAYLGVKHLVRCSTCKIRLSTWRNGDNPLCIHFSIATNRCGFLRESMTTSRGRMNTFQDWPVTFLKPRDMAKAGFVYTGVGDKVKCFTCLEEFDKWEKNDTPMGEHMNHSSQCPFVISYKRKFNNPSGPYGLTSLGVKTIEDKLHTEGIVLFVNPLFYETMVALNARLKSFNRCVISLQLDINAVCKAGFFYSGNGYTDSLTCFYCGVTIIKCNGDFDPWEVHAEMSKTCNYLFLKKGKSFCDRANDVESDEIKSNQLKLFKLIAAKKNTLTLKSKMSIQSTKKHFKEIKITKILSDKIEEHLFQKLAPNLLPDNMLCKICYKEVIEVAIVPCGHAIACIECALSFNYCSMCRMSCSRLIRIHLCVNKKNDENLKLKPCSSKMSSGDELNPKLCKVCLKEEMSTVFLPCRHVYTCVKCAEETSECLVCREDVYSFIKIYL